MFRKIVVPLDGSESGERVLSRIAPLRAPNSTLHLVRVVPGSAGSRPTPLEELRLIEAESYLSFLASEPGDGVRTEVRHGAVAEEILAAASAAGADLIGLSSCGESGPARATVGTTAGRLILAAACPVFILGASREEPQPAPSKPQRVIVALDGSVASEACLAPARQLARGFGAALILLHVIEPLWAAGDSASADQQAQEVRRIHERLRNLAAQLAQEGISARPLIARGEPAGEIQSQIERRRGDLLCLSTSSRGPVGRLFFGTVAQKLMGFVRVPVIAVRREHSPG
jgi:nucleotide-binding universal stress UspA family protein